MKKKIIISSVILAVFVIWGATGQQKPVKEIRAEESQQVLKSGAVYAVVPRGGVVYDNIDGNCVDMIVSGTKVEIIKDKNKEWYFVKYGGRLGWVKNNVLKIPPDYVAETKPLSMDFIEEYADKNFKSSTSHFVWVDIDRQKIYILEKNDGWKLKKSIVCSTGKNSSPTLRGSFTLEARGKWFYSQRLKSGAVNWVRFSGSYLFHSVAMDENRNITDNVLGQRHSSGCVRMSVEDSQWFYDNMEYGTSVWIY